MERSDSTKLYPVFEGNVSACGKDLPSGMHDDMNSWSVLTCGKDRQAHDNSAVCGREAQDTLDQNQWLKVDRECDSCSEWHVVRNTRQGKTVHRSCDSETHDRTDTGTILVSVPSCSSVSLCVKGCASCTGPFGVNFFGRDGPFWGQKNMKV